LILGKTIILPRIDGQCSLTQAAKWVLHGNPRGYHWWADKKASERLLIIKITAYHHELTHLLSGERALIARGFFVIYDIPCALALLLGGVIWRI
jgi:hypothetical protein